MSGLGAFLLCALCVVSCSAVDSGEVGTDPARIDPTTSVRVSSEATSPDRTTIADPPATDPPVDPPVSDPPGPRPPTTAATVVYAGSDAGHAWTALAIWNGAAWGLTFDPDVGRGVDTDFPAVAFDRVAVASLGLPQPVVGLTYGDDDVDCLSGHRGPTLDVGVPIGDIAIDSGYKAVAVASDWDLQPRPVEQVGRDAETYRTIGASFVEAEGVDPAGGQVAQVVRADLDGDGIEEVLVTFEKIHDDLSTPGDFSVVYARYPAADGTDVDDLLFAYYPEVSDERPALGRGAVMAVADLNGDGVMEVLLTRRFWDAHLVDLYEFRDGTLSFVADGGCVL